MNINDRPVTPAQAELISNVRRLWINHIIWIRSYIISAAVDYGNKEFITQRIQENFKNFSDMLIKFYGFEKSRKIESLFAINLFIFIKYMEVLKTGTEEEIKVTRDEWYKSGYNIADYLSSINPYASNEEWIYLIQDHLRVIEVEAIYRIAEHYGAETEQFGKAENLTLQLADYMANSIIRQFNIR